MKKVTFIMALAAAAGLASCTAQSPKANLKTDVDSLSYAIGMARTEGLDQYLAQQGIDSTQMTDFLKGFNEGASKIDKKDVFTLADVRNYVNEAKMENNRPVLLLVQDKGIVHFAALKLKDNK